MQDDPWKGEQAKGDQDDKKPKKGNGKKEEKEEAKEEPKCKKGGKEEEPKKEAMKVAKKVAKKRPAAADLGDCAGEIKVPEDDPVSQYMYWDGVDPVKSIMLNRVHSNVWHKVLKAQTAAGVDIAAAKARASSDAIAAKDRFLRFKNML